MQRIYVTIRPLNREDSVLYFPPEAFGPFRVLHQIGAGTLGPVFRAYEPGRDRLVAVKVFRLDLTPEQAAALVTELDALVRANITHPNIAAPIAAGLEHGAAYVAQEYAVGDSIDVVLRERGRMPVRDVVALVQSLAAAIDHAADRGVHHGLLHLRDIVVGADTARITGFGIADALSKVGAKLPTRTAYALNAQIASAQPSHIATADETAGTPADIYSLGAIAFEAATGKRLSAENLKDFEADHGTELGRAFRLRPQRAGDFAAALRAGAGLNASATYETDTTGLKASTGYETETPIAETAVVPTFPPAQAPLDDPLDRVIDLGTSQDLDLDEPPVFSVDREPAPPSPAFPPSWSPQPPRALQTSDVDPEPSRRWPIVAMFLVFAILAALSVGFFLRSPRPVPTAEPTSGVDATIVDLPAPAPSTPAPTTADASPSAPPSQIATADKPMPKAQTGSVLVRSTPADADVVVNGKPRGKTPLALRDLVLGSYTIRVARAGYAAEERALELTARRPTTSTTFNLRPSARTANKTGPGIPVGAAGRASATAGGLNVKSRPAGARVFVNDRLIGVTPVAIPSLPAGPATVRIELVGYRLWTTKVHISAGRQTPVAASLERP